MVDTARRFTWFDAAVLTGATCLGVFVAKDLFASYEAFQHSFDDRAHARHWLMNLETASVFLFVSWSLALLVLRLRAPRPRLRDLVRGPGTVPGLVVALIASRQAIESLVDLFRPPGTLPNSLWTAWQLLTSYAGYIVLSTPASAGFIVAATWFALLPGRWWRPESTWVDRAGRCLGCYWIVMYLFECYERMLT